jgi:hypothetical protein
MFGLEDQNKKKQEPFVFDFEHDMKDPEKCQKLKNLIDERVQKIKTSLSAGEENKEDLNAWGSLLQGYLGLLKVMARCIAKK